MRTQKSRAPLWAVVCAALIAPNTSVSAQSSSPLRDAIAGVEAEIAAFEQRPERKDDIAPRLRLVAELRRLLSPVTFDTIDCTSAEPYVFQNLQVISSDTIVTCPSVLPASVQVRVARGSTVYFKESVTFEAGARLLGDGEEGRAGDRGTNVEPPWNSQGDGDFAAALTQCRADPNSSERGGRGGPGRQGGPGAIIVFAKKPTMVSGTLSAAVPVAGGAGGARGPGGSGRLLRNGRNFYCDGCTMNCPSGPDGDAGKPGLIGFRIVL